MKKWLLAAALFFSASAMAHPIKELYPIAEDLNENYSKVAACVRSIDSSDVLVPVCDYLASRGAQVLTVLVHSLEADGIEVKRENRRELKDIAWRELSLWELSYGAWVLTDDDLERGSKYLGKERPDLIRPHMTEETYNKLEKGGFLD